MPELTEDVKALRYAGAMGHTYAAVRTYSDGRIECSGQFSCLASVKRLMNRDDRVYRRQRTGWRRVNVKPAVTNPFAQEMNK